MSKKKNTNEIIVTSVEELGSVLGLSDADVAEMEFRSEITVALSKVMYLRQSRRLDL